MDASKASNFTETSMEKREIRLEFAKKMADELWERYMKSTEPDKRRIYGLRFTFWASIRERLENEDQPIEG